MNLCVKDLAHASNEGSFPVGRTGLIAGTRVGCLTADRGERQVKVRESPATLAVTGAISANDSEIRRTA